MMGVLYLRETRKVLSLVSEVVSYTDTDLLGKEIKLRGIDLTQADFVIVESTDLQPGDIIDLSVVTDVRHLVPETPEQKINQLQANLDMAVLEITTAMAAQQGV